MIKFPSIDQYRQAIKNVQSWASYHNIKTPTLVVEGTVKVHGTNAGLVRPVGGGDIIAQSREREVSIESDNAGFAFWVEANKDSLQKLFDEIERVTNPTDGFVQVFGEWAGGNIQSGVGVNGLPKFLMVFGIRISEDAEPQVWEPREIYEEVFSVWSHPNVFHKYQFKNWELTIDFANPALVQNDLVELTNQVEHDCPVARFFKPDAVEGTLIGEGIVWTLKNRGEHEGFQLPHIVYKVKGERHSVSKVKTTAMVDVEKAKSSADFVEYAVTENRLKQMFDKMVELGHPIDQTQTGTYIKLVQADVLKEEIDVMVASLLETKDVGGLIARRAKEFWFENI